MDAGDRNQGEVEIAYPGQQPVEGGLIRQRTRDEGLAVLRRPQLHSFKGLGPGRREMTLDADRIMHLVALPLIPRSSHSRTSSSVRFSQRVQQAALLSRSLPL